MKPRKEILINLRVTREEYEALLKQAVKNMGGNLSAWLRYAGLCFNTVGGLKRKEIAKEDEK